MKKFLFILFVFVSVSVNAQNFEYRVLFEGIGDNREFFNDLGFPQTILGTRGGFETGVKSDNHRLRAGLTYFFEFGSEFGDRKPELTMYYQFAGQNTEFLFGAFPRRDKIDFPLAMLTDTFLYYRPNIEGMYGKTSWDWGYQNIFVDWVSRQTEHKSEIFMAGSSGEIYSGNLFLQNYIMLNHDAVPIQRKPDDQIEDYFGYSLQAGLKLSENSVITGYVKAGILSSLYRKRSISHDFHNVSSFFAEAKGKYKNYGIKTVLNSGAANHRFAYGDHFYRAKNYLRTDLIWYFINSAKVKGTFNVSFHVIDWEELNLQQQMSVIYVFGNKEIL